MGKYCFLVTFLFGAIGCLAQYQPGFSEVEVTQWSNPVSMGFDTDGRMYVAERAGKVYKYENQQKTLLLDITEEVANYGDIGLLGMVLDPLFVQNGYLYLYYAVDHHYLINYGTPAYNANTTDQTATICRVTRYTVATANGFNTIVTGSRYILIGETKSTGIPMTGFLHAGGDLAFAEDGSLIISTGDGVGGAPFESAALAEGIITQDEYNADGQWRCQMQNSLNGKILRINPATGDGLASNPYYNSSSPRSPVSRIWAKGFRNPFRFTIKPHSGSHNIAEGNPGILYVGDVGLDNKEEINIVTSAGQNFGWPRYEGVSNIYKSNPTYNNMTHKIPTIEWGRSGTNAIFTINNIATDVTSLPQFQNFNGGCAIGGIFYEGEYYPESYHHSYFFSDLNSNWVKNFKFDNSESPTLQNNFHGDLRNIVKYVYNPINESIYYVSFDNKIARIAYSSNVNLPPVARFTQSDSYGASPLQVVFDAGASYDPENLPLSFQWNFGDGSIATGSNPSHSFTAVGMDTYTVTLTVTDVVGNTASATNLVSLNNTPPHIINTGIDAMNKFDANTNTNLTLTAQVNDNEQISSSLSYLWQVNFNHNDHIHLEFTSSQANAVFVIPSLGCDNNIYAYSILLTITDLQGLSSSLEKKIFQNCNTSDNTPPSVPRIAIENFNKKGFTIKWEPPTDAGGVESQILHINNQTRVLVNNVNTFSFISAGPIAGQNFEVYLEVIDIGGNKSKSSKLYFKRPEVICAEEVYLSNMAAYTVSNGYGPIELDRSNGELAANDGNILQLNGETFAKGIGCAPLSTIVYNISALNNNTFYAKIGLDDEIPQNIGCGSVQFSVYKDDVLAYVSPIMLANSNTETINLDVSNVTFLKLVVSDGGDNPFCDHADWADAKLLANCAEIDNNAPNYMGSISPSILNGQILLSWPSTTDNQSANPNYEIWLDGVKIYTQTNIGYTLSNVSNGPHIITLQAKDMAGNITGTSIDIFKCNDGLIDPSMVSTYNCTSTCTSVSTIKNGDWTDPSVWQCYKIPSPNDTVTINPGHEINIPIHTEIQVKAIDNNGKIIFLDGSKITLIMP
jgi:glucose/arabinose dehydrogenase